MTVKKSIKRLSGLSLKAISIALVLSGCYWGPAEKTGSSLPLSNQADTVGQINHHRLLTLNSEPDSWLTAGRDYQQSYYSPLKKVNKRNIKQLGFAWQYEIDTTHGFEATPTVVDGVMFTSGPKGAVYALDAKTGSQHWHFEPNIDTSVLRKASTGSPVNRGVAVWEGIVYVASLDGYLYALNADTGKTLWIKDTITERDRGYTITGAPYIANNKVVIGNSGADLDARGYITAYDSKTGQQHWRFFTVPGNPNKGFEHPELEMAAKTWDPNSLWETGLGGTVWDGMAYDPTLNLLYVGTGNAVPFPRKLRSPAGGDNLFVSSILAINPDNGRLIWHYQTTPADNWDYTATQKMILADLTINDKTRKVIMQAPKNGFFYMLDRITGEFISAEPYVTVNWASHIDKNTGRPVETAQAEYFDEPKLIFPSMYGGHNWQPMAYNPNTGLVYIPAIEMAAVFAKQNKPFKYQKGGYNFAINPVFPTKDGMKTLGGKVASAKHFPSLDTLTSGQPDYTTRGFLRAWDPVQQKLVWQAETSGQWAGEKFATWNGGGVMTTAGGLVFQGRGTGELVALDAQSGEQLYSINVGTSMMAAPMSYAVDGEQYIAIMAGIGGTIGGNYPPGSAAYKYGNKGRIVTFKLNGGEIPLPAKIQRDNIHFPKPPVERRGTLAQVIAGKALFQRNCSKCHTNSGGGGIPDLRKMSKSTQEEFLNIVIDGARADQGMGSFKELLSLDEVKSIQHYLIDLAWQAYYEDKQKRVEAKKEPFK